MLVNEFFATLSDELSLLAPRYAAERLGHPALVPYPTIAALLDVTKARKEGKKHRVSLEGAAVLCALVDLHRRTRARLWGALLLRAFRPMIRATAKRLVGGSGDERVALLLASFLEAVLRVDPRRDSPRIAMYVRQATRRGVFRELRKERTWEDVGFGEDADLCLDPATVEPPALRGVWARGRGQKGHEIVPVAQVRGGLWLLVRRHHGSLPADQQARIYRRLQQRRRRAAERLRDRMTPTRAVARPETAVSS